MDITSSFRETTRRAPRTAMVRAPGSGPGRRVGPGRERLARGILRPGVCAVAVRPFLSCGFPDVLRLGERWPWTPHDPPSCHRLAARGTRWQTRRRTAPPWAAQGLNQGLLGRDDGTPQLADPHVVRVASQTLDLDLRKPLVARVPVDDHRERVGEVRGRAVDDRE